jgi:hypothetical protein
MMHKTSRLSSLWVPVALAAVALAWRVAKLGFGVPDVIPNFSPWLAVAFAGSALMPRHLHWAVWPALLVACDCLLSRGDMAGMWSVYLCLGVAGLAGGALRGRVGGLGVVAGTAVCSVVFYLVTCTQAWWLNPVYAQSVAGWLQAVTVGDPAWQPQAWVFGLRSLLSEVGFATLLVLAGNTEAVARRREGLSWGWTLSPGAV